VNDFFFIILRTNNIIILRILWKIQLLIICIILNIYNKPFPPDYQIRQNVFLLHPACRVILNIINNCSNNYNSTWSFRVPSRVPWITFMARSSRYGLLPPYSLVFRSVLAEWVPTGPSKPITRNSDSSVRRQVKRSDRHRQRSAP